MSAHGGKSTGGTGSASSHEKEGGKQGVSDRENMANAYHEEQIKKGHTHSEMGFADEHGSGSAGEKGTGFRDKLLHKEGNYEKVNIVFAS